MKSYYLYGLPSREQARQALDQVLPDQSFPWVLNDAAGDTVAYFSVGENERDPDQPDDPTEPGPFIVVDISGRYYVEDRLVIGVLEDLKRHVGGVIRDCFESNDLPRILAFSDLDRALHETIVLLQNHDDRWVSARLDHLRLRLARGDTSIVQSALSEATGSMGSLRDRILCVANGDNIEERDETAVNSDLRRLVTEVEIAARAAMAFV